MDEVPVVFLAQELVLVARYRRTSAKVVRVEEEVMAGAQELLRTTLAVF
jgi:hypothetical protein